MVYDDFLPALVVVLGLVVGSFLNVVIFRLPKIMDRQWRMECQQYLQSDLNASADFSSKHDEPVFNLAYPRSHCGQCAHVLRWYENIPVLSYCFLCGRCSACGTQISLRYPVVELLTAFVFGWLFQRWGLGWTFAAWVVFSVLLLCLAFIDWDTTLLPDDLTYPLLWSGLLAANFSWIAVSLSSALMGAAIAYLFLWSIFWIFKWITGKEGMGYGDFKLFAALGAWFGVEALLPLILISSIFGIVVAVILKFRSSLRAGGYVPFGPFLAFAGFVLMMVDLNGFLKISHLGF